MDHASIHNPGDQRPLLLLDVDGVLHPYAMPCRPPNALELSLDGETVWFVAEHGAWLCPLLERYQLVWATGWEHDANRLIAPVLGLPQLPVITFPRDPHGRFVKLTTLQRVVGDAPLAWIDDELSFDAELWAHNRPAPTLLLASDPAVGLTKLIIDRLIAFSDALHAG